MSTHEVFDIATSALPLGVTLIEASAGTGKTYAIAGLFVRLVLEGHAPREILVTTFTEAATAELRDRVRRALREAVVAFAEPGRACPPYLAQLRNQHADGGAKLEAALRSFDEGTITTIHGFCHATLREHALESGELFEAELLADDSALRQELAEDFWRTHFYSAEPLHSSLARGAGLSPDAFAALIKGASSQPLAEILPVHSADIDAALDEAWTALREGWPGWTAAVREIFAAAKAWGNKPYNRPDEIGPLLDSAASALTDEVPTPKSLADLGRFSSSALAAGAARRGPGAPAHPFFEAVESFATARDRWLATLRPRCVLWAREQGARRKRERSLLSFDDLLTRLHAALHRPGGTVLATRLRERYRAALIDEFQDTDRLQAEIFQRVFATGESRLVLIGDPKQAIYAFRGADVFTYLAAARQAARTYDLPANHRSEHALVRAVNHLFEGHARPFFLPGIGFRPVEPMGLTEQTPLTLNGQRSAPLRFWLAEDERGDLRVGNLRDALPAAIAGEVARLIAGGARIGDRTVRPGDFAILVRANHEAPAMRAALTALGVPAVVHSSESVFASPEANELSQLLAAIAHPSQEPLIRAALSGVCFALDAAELHRLEHDAAAWEALLQLFQRAHELWLRRGFMAMFRAVLHEGEVRSRLLALPEGERRLTNLLHLAESLHQAATDGRLGIEGTLSWFHQQRTGGGVPAEYELRLERDEAAVQILTLHKSKGLEFGIVFCPLLWCTNDQGKEPPVRCHRGENLVLDFGSEDFEEHAERASDEGLAEELRTLYVGLTRAKHQCIVVWGRCGWHAGCGLHWLLHAREGVKSRNALVEHAKNTTAAQLKTELQGIAESSGGVIAVEPLPTEPSAPLSNLAEGSDILRVRAFDTVIDRRWRISSFSGLIADQDDETPDYDAAASPPTAAGELTGIHAFPRGKKPGTCLHEIFQHLAFDNDAAITPLVERKLASFGFAAEHTAPVAEAVHRALDGELARGARLRGLPSAKRLVEVEFVMRAASFSGAQLATLVGEGAGRLEFDARRGLIKGFIDLVAEIGGRYYLVDWKSNWLGPSTADYDPTSLMEAMHAARYGLQYHLYTVALHRHLRARWSGYRFAEHFGGVAYVFLRGLDPMHPERGIFRARPSAAEIDAIDRLFTP